MAIFFLIATKTLLKALKDTQGRPSYLVSQVLLLRVTFFFIHKVDNTGLAKLAVELGVAAMRTLFTKMCPVFLAGKFCLSLTMIYTLRHTTTLTRTFHSSIFVFFSILVHLTQLTTEFIIPVFQAKKLHHHGRLGGMGRQSPVDLLHLAGKLINIFLKLSS